MNSKYLKKDTNLKYLPPPVLVGLVAREVVEVPQALHRLGSEEVVCVVGLQTRFLITATVSAFLLRKVGSRIHNATRDVVSEISMSLGAIAVVSQ